MHQINGAVQVLYDLREDMGVQQLIEDRQSFNDGRYHYVTFFRTGSNATLRVDDMPPIEILAKS